MYKKIVKTIPTPPPVKTHNHLEVDKKKIYHPLGKWEYEYDKNEMLRIMAQEHMKKIDDLSGEKFIVWYGERWGEKHYHVWNKKENLFHSVPEEQVKPKSIRERLHNIQENTRATKNEEKT